MHEVVGLFPTPFMRVPRALNSDLVGGLSAHFSALAGQMNNSSSNLGVIFGHAISHELGHLIGLPHTSIGIMRAQWGRQEWVAAVAGGLVFSRPDFKLSKLSH